jgi:hypothetical protein
MRMLFSITQAYSLGLATARDLPHRYGQARRAARFRSAG